MNFKVGQKVVCVDDSPGWYQGGRGLVKNRVYSITAISAVEHIRVNGMDYYWSPARFRPFTEPLQEIEYTLEGKKLIETPSLKEMQDATYSAFDFKGIDTALIPEIKTGIIKFMGNISKIYSN